MSEFNPRRGDVLPGENFRISSRLPTFKTTIAGREVWFPYFEGHLADQLLRKFYIAIANAEDPGVQQSLRESEVLLTAYTTEESEELVVVWPPERFGEKL